MKGRRRVGKEWKEGGCGGDGKGLWEVAVASESVSITILVFLGICRKEVMRLVWFGAVRCVMVVVRGSVGVIVR